MLQWLALMISAIGPQALIVTYFYRGAKLFTEVGFIPYPAWINVIECQFFMNPKSRGHCFIKSWRGHSIDYSPLASCINSGKSEYSPSSSSEMQGKSCGSTVDIRCRLLVGWGGGLELLPGMKRKALRRLVQ